jgi:YVTN family beta-propeller protein
MWIACGDIYRPVVLPLNLTPPNSANFHSVFAIASNGSFSPNPPVPNSAPTFSFGVGTTMELDVAGDSIIAETNLPPLVGINPTHATILSNNSRVFVTSSGSFESGGADLVYTFSPAISSIIATGFGTISTISLPPGSLPDFVTSDSQANQVYVANFGTSSVTVINVATNTIINTVPTGLNPVAMTTAVFPGNTKLYVLNQGSNSVSSFNTQDMSQNPVAGFSGKGKNPVWAVTRSDGQKVYVVSQGDGKLWTFDTATDSVVGSFSVGVGANYVYYEPNSQRLYVTNPATSVVFIFSASGGANDTPSLLQTINISSAAVSGNYPSCVNPCPVSVAALPDGSRAYVASYTLIGCTDPVFSTSCQVMPQVTIIDTQANAAKTTIFPLSLATSGATPTSVAEAFDCIPSIPYNPSGVPVPGTSPLALGFSGRFRLSTAVAADSSRAYVGFCDAGAIGVIDAITSSLSSGSSNTPDTLVRDLAAPFGVGFTQSSNITAVSESGNIVTATLDVPLNNAVPGLVVDVSGVGIPAYNGEFEISAVNGTTVQYVNTVTGLGASSGGTASTNQPPLQNPVFMFTGQ